MNVKKGEISTAILHPPITRHFDRNDSCCPEKLEVLFGGHCTGSESRRQGDSLGWDSDQRFRPGDSLGLCRRIQAGTSIGFPIVFLHTRECRLLCLLQRPTCGTASKCEPQKNKIYTQEDTRQKIGCSPTHHADTQHALCKNHETRPQDSGLSM